MVETKMLWLNGCETSPESSAYGEVVVDQVNLLRSPSELVSVETLPHGTKVEFMDEQQVDDGQEYFNIQALDRSGWVKSSLVADKWSSFTFLARLHEASACKDLEVQVAYAGMELVIRQNSLAITTAGDPADFDAISTAAEGFASRLVSAQAPLSATPLRVEFINWVETSAAGSESPRTVGFMPLPDAKRLQVSNQNIETAMGILPQMAEVPYLDLALSDFVQALRYPQHALIFLARSIESIEYYFDRFAREQSDKGKERVMQEALELESSDVEFVTRRANESHRRHADREGRAVPLDSSELVKCFEITGLIIAKFSGFLAQSR